MEIKMGDRIITMVDKTANWGRRKDFIPKGTVGLTCEIYEEGAILVGVGDGKSTPWIFDTFYECEYDKLSKN